MMKLGIDNRVQAVFKLEVSKGGVKKETNWFR